MAEPEVIWRDGDDWLVYRADDKEVKILRLATTTATDPNTPIASAFGYPCGA